MGSSMNKVLKYRVYCETDSKYEYVILEEGSSVPDKCPTNTSHTITSSATKVVGELSASDVNSRQALAQGGPSLSSRGFGGTASANSTETVTYTFTEDLYLKNAEFITISDNWSKESLITEAHLQIPDGQGGWTTIHTYVKDYCIPRSGEKVMDNPAITEINVNGMRLLLTYDNKHTEAVSFHVNIICYSP